MSFNSIVRGKESEPTLGSRTFFWVTWLVFLTIPIFYFERYAGQLTLEELHDLNEARFKGYLQEHGVSISKDKWRCGSEMPGSNELESIYRIFWCAADSDQATYALDVAYSRWGDVIYSIHDVVKISE